MDNSSTASPFLAPTYATAPFFDPYEQHLDQWNIDPTLSLQPDAYHMHGGNAEVCGASLAPAAFTCFFQGCERPFFPDSASLEHHVQQHFGPPPSTYGSQAAVQYSAYQTGNPHEVFNAIPHFDTTGPAGAFNLAAPSPPFGNMDGMPADDAASPTSGSRASSVNGRYHCTYLGCKESVKYAGDLGRHMKKHEEGPRQFACPMRGCHRQGERGFARKDKLNDHLKAKHKMVPQ